RDAVAANTALQLVDLAILGDDILRQHGITVAERLHGLRNLGLDQRGHLNDRLLDLAQLLVKCLPGHVSRLAFRDWQGRTCGDDRDAAAVSALTKAARDEILGALI